MNVLSLFDSMSCGQLALKKANIKVSKYYASEIDKYAIKVTQHNFPNTVQVGDIRNLEGFDFPKIDLLMGGSPCQGFSFAGKLKGMSTKCDVEITTLKQYLEFKMRKITNRTRQLHSNRIRHAKVQDVRERVDG